MTSSAKQTEDAHRSVWGEAFDPVSGEWRQVYAMPTPPVQSGRRQEPRDLSMTHPLTIEIKGPRMGRRERTIA